MKSQLGKDGASAYKSKLLKTMALCALVIALAVIVVQKKNAVSTALWDKMNCGICVFYLQPNDPQLFFDIGNYYFGSGAYDIGKAEKYFKKTLDIDPQITGAHYQIARIYFIRGDFYTALDEINKEIELRPDFKRSYYVRGLIYGYSGRLKEAENDFVEFLKWKPNSWAGHNDLAWIYFQEGKYEEARDTARAGLNIAPDNPWLLNSLGVALLNEGKLTEAKKALTDALTFANAMTPADWGRSYPGNNPSVYGDGLNAMRASIKRNLAPISSQRLILGKIYSNKSACVPVRASKTSFSVTS